MRCLIKFISVLLLVSIVGTVGLYFASDWLLVKQEPFAADYAVVLAGDPRRALHAAEIYRQGLVHGVYVSIPARVGYQETLDGMGIVTPRQEELMSKVLEASGVALKDVCYFGNGSVSTVEEAEKFARIWASRRFSFLVVTSPYHMRRAEMIFRDALPEARFRVLANRYEPFPREWWEDQQTLRNVLLELVKILFYHAGGRFYSSQVAE